MLLGLPSTLIRFEQTYNEHSQVCIHVSAFCANTKTKMQTATHTPGRRGKIHSALQSTPLRPLNPKNSLLLDGCRPLLISLPDIESTSFASGYIKTWLMFFCVLVSAWEERTSKIYADCGDVLGHKFLLAVPLNQA